MGAHEGAAFLQMTLVAGVVDVVAHQGFFARAAVRIVAVRTNDLALLNRVSRRAIDLGALFLVAGKAHLALDQLIAHCILGGVYLVAGCAGNVVGGVGTHGPMYAFAALVAG